MRFHSVLPGLPLIAAAVALAACGGAQTPPVTSAPLSTNAQSQANAAICCTVSGGQLYLALATKTSSGYTGNIASYSLPISGGQSPATTFAGASLGVAQDGTKLYVSSAAVNPANNHVNVYNLPSRNHEGAAVSVSLAGAYGVAAGGGFLYVSSYTQNTVSAFALPIVKGESPSVTISIAGGNGSAIAVNSKFLFVANYANGASGAGSLTEYALPLKSGESPTATVSGLTSPIGVAVDTAHHLYVASYFGMSVQVYGLPLKSAELPATTLSLPSNGFGLAADSGNLYVTNFKDTMWAYPLPITSGESPGATLTGLAHPDGVAI